MEKKDGCQPWSSVTIIDGKLEVLKQRKLSQAEWLSFHMGLLGRLNDLERGLPVSTDTLAFAAVTTASMLQEYITWMLDMAVVHSWNTMREFDETLRDRMNQTQTGSYMLTAIITLFLTKLATSDLSKKLSYSKDTDRKNT